MLEVYARGEESLAWPPLTALPFWARGGSSAAAAAPFDGGTRVAGWPRSFTLSGTAWGTSLLARRGANGGGEEESAEQRQVASRRVASRQVSSVRLAVRGDGFGLWALRDHLGQSPWARGLS